MDIITTSRQRAFHVMAKPAGAQCNLDCRYCFYMPKAVLNPERRPRMYDDLLARFVRQMLECQPGPEVSFAWQGSEPILVGLPSRAKAERKVRNSMMITAILHPFVKRLIPNGWVV